MALDFDSPSPQELLAAESAVLTMPSLMDAVKAAPHGKGSPEPLAMDACKKLLNYVEENRDSLWYGRRLQEGLPIGSGLIECAGKSTLAKRLKINSARWRIQRAERMGAIRCLQYSRRESPQRGVTPPSFRFAPAGATD